MRFGRSPAWLKIVFLCTLVFILAYGLISLEAWRTGAEGTGRPTTYSPGSLGYKALYLWLKDLGLPVHRWEKPLGELTPATTVLLIIQPEVGLDPGELNALDNWVRKGGTLIVSAMPPDLLMKHFGVRADRTSYKDKKEGPQKVFFQPGPYIRGERKIVSYGHPGLTSSKPEMILHARDRWGGLIASVKEGEGRVIAIADPILFTNESLRKGDHARLVLDILLSHLGTGILMVDEYHHGYGRATTVVSHFVRSNALDSFLQSVVLLLILWLAKGRRFGVPRPPVMKEYRSSMEYVKAMAQLFRRGQARGYALERILRWVEEESKRLLVDMDRALTDTRQSVRQRLQGGKLTDGELLGHAQRLYAALEKAKRVAPGEGKR
jgi:hypothetical protein